MYLLLFASANPLPKVKTLALKLAGWAKGSEISMGRSDIEWTEATWNPVAGLLACLARLHQLLRDAHGCPASGDGDAEV
jgi:hypothetical protein